MATIPTKNPIPSESARDLKFNAGKIDEVVNSPEKNYTDRFGINRLTIAGITIEAYQAIQSIGYITVDSFEDGAQLTMPIEILRLKSSGDYYRWDGAFPKTITAGSTPESSGGIGLGKWVSVGDGALRSALSDPDQGARILSDRYGTAGSLEFTQHDKNNVTALLETFENANSALLSGARNIRVAHGNHIISGSITIPESTTLIIEPGAYFSGGEIINKGQLIAPKEYMNGIPYPAGFQVNLNGNVYISLSSSFSSSPDLDSGDKWKIIEVNTETKLSVPSRFSDCYKALSFISGANLNAKTTISFEAGNYTVGTISPNVRNGNNLWFSGDSGDNKIVNINIGTGDGFFCGAGMSYSISDITIQSENWKAHGTWTGVSNGILATQGGRIYCKNVLVTKCYYGFQAALGGIIDAEDCESSEAGDGGFFAFNGGHINALNCDSHDHYDSGFIAILGFGYVAEAGGTMWVRNAETYGSVGGVFANIGSSIRCDSLKAFGNGNGIIVKAGSVVECNGSTINANISDNVRVTGGSVYNCSGTSHDSSNEGSGIVAEGGSTINSQSSTTNNNPSSGISCSLVSSAKLNSSHTSTGNSTSNYTPAFGMSGNKNSWIDN